LVGLVHVTVIGVLATILSLLFGVTTVTSAVLMALVGGLVWFVLGFGLFGTLATAAAALLGLRRALLVVGSWVGVVFVISAVLLAGDPGGVAAAVLSVLPPFAPVLLPGRMAAGVAPAWQVLLAVVLALASVGGLAWFAGRVYPRSLLKA
jgi:ABC-2 type transport system permease protein